MQIVVDSPGKLNYDPFVMLPTGNSSITDRAEQCIKALRASGHANPARYTFVDSATNVNMSSSCANATRVEPIPEHERPEVAGVSGGVEQTHHVYRAVPPALRMPGRKDTYRTMWSANNAYDITSTDTLAALGLDVFTVSAEDGQMYLSPSGLDPRDERTRIKCERVSGLQALPTERATALVGADAAPTTHAPTRLPPGLTLPGRPSIAVPAGASHAGADSAADEPVEIERSPAASESDVQTATPITLGDDVPRVPRAQRTPVPYHEFRQRLGNPSHDETGRAAKRMGVRLVGADDHRGRLDHERATAIQTATAARKVADPGIFPRARVTVITDTVGPMPTSALGNIYFQSWFIKGQPGFIVATCAPDKSAASSWAGFEAFCKARGVEVLRDAIHQSIELVHDCGTEYLGVFLQEARRAGFVQGSATPHKKKKFAAHPSEGANRRLEDQMRINLVGARRLFQAWGIDARAYWDRAVTYGARQPTVRSHCREHDVAHGQVKRELLAPGFGALGTVKVQEGDAGRKLPGGKQLADKSVLGLFVGMTPNHKCIMVLEDKSIMVTTDVGFPSKAPQRAATTNEESDAAWMAPITAAFDAAYGTRAAEKAATAERSQPPSAKPDTQSGRSVPAVPSQVPGQDAPSAKPGAQPGVPHQVPSQNATAVPSQGVLNPELSEAESEADFLTGSDHSDFSSGHDHEFTDEDGKTVAIGDHVTVTRDDGSVHHGIATDIDTTDERTPGGEVRVDYADGTEDFEYHPLQPNRRVPMRKRFDAATHRALAGRWARRVCLRLTVMPPPQAPHRSVRPHLDDVGNILPQYLDGSATLPPAPPLPGPEARIVTPITTEQALAQPEAMFWLHSHVGEWRGHLAPVNRPPTFHYTTEKPKGRKLHVKFIYVVKRNQDGTIAKFKGRAVIAGWWLKRGVHYEESYTGQTPWSDVRDLEAVGVNLKLRVHEADLVQAFPFAGMPPAPNGEPVVAVMPASSKMYTEEGLELFVVADQAWYGHPAAGNALARKVCRMFTGRGIEPGEERCTVQLVQHPSQPVVFVAQYPVGHEWHGEIFWLHVSTDNLRTYTSCDAMQHEFMEWLDRNFQTTGGRVALQDQSPQTFNGVRFSYIQGAVQLDMPAYVAKLLDEVGLSHANPAATPLAKGTVLGLVDSPQTATDQLAVVEGVNAAFNTRFIHYSEVVTYYSHLVSSIGWIASKVAPILLMPHSMLCRMLSAPTVAAFKALKRVLRYLAGRPNIYMTYVPDREYDWRHGDWPRYYMQSDASYADDPSDRRSQGGHVGGFENQAVTTAESRKGHRVATSTDQAEAQHAGAACKQAEYKRNFLSFLGVPMEQPTILEVDNYANYLRTSAPIRKWSPASKQLDVLERYTVECIERKVIKLRHRPGNLPEEPRRGMGFKVDALTKILTAAATEFYGRELHGPDIRHDVPSGSHGG